jgi:Integrase core domain
MTVDGPNQLWVADITYIAITTGFVYLAAILDAWSRRVVGYAISRSIDARLATAALTAAIHAREPPKGCVHHSDRGSQYASERYRGLLTEHALIGSMGRRGNAPRPPVSITRPAAGLAWAVTTTRLPGRRRTARSSAWRRCTGNECAAFPASTGMSGTRSRRPFSRCSWASRRSGSLGRGHPPFAGSAEECQYFLECHYLGLTGFHRVFPRSDRCPWIRLAPLRWTPERGDFGTNPGGLGQRDWSIAARWAEVRRETHSAEK